jgi:hypothetical protein
VNHSAKRASFDLARVKVFPLHARKSLTSVEDILIPPDRPAPPVTEEIQNQINRCAAAVRVARARGASVILMYGAHLLRNGAALLLERLMAQGWITHLATNGAGTIHDWEYAWFGRSTESVEQNVATGTFGTWDETSRNIHLALYAGSLRSEGYGASLGRYILEDGAVLPSAVALEKHIRERPSDPLTGPRADLLHAMQRLDLPQGRIDVVHRWKHASILAQAFRHNVPFTVHPGIGYDIISNHPIFDAALIGRAAGIDFRLMAGSVEGLDGGVVLSVGSAIMGPQVFEKTLSCVNNVRLQEQRSIVQDHQIFVVDLQDGGQWDWTKGEPPKTNPAYYLRFCKSFSRMGGPMHYLQYDNAAFIHHLHHQLCPS